MNSTLPDTAKPDNAPGLVNAEELGALLRPTKPLTRQTIWLWTCRGRIPETAVVRFGRSTRYSVPRLREAGWIA